MIRAIPTINTSRLTLRPMRPEDFDRFAALWAAPIAVDHAGGGPFTRSQAWDLFLRNAGHWHMTGFGAWAIEDRASRKMIGETGFRYPASDLGEEFDAYPEASVILGQEVLGAGIGLEALSAAHDWFDRVITGPLVARLRDGDDLGAALAARLGYAALRSEGDGDDRVLLLRRNSPPVG